MSIARIITTFILVDLSIIAVVIWCAFQRMPVRRYFLPAVALFILNGIWLVWMILKRTPRG